LLKKITDDKRFASRDLIPQCDRLLQDHSLTIRNLDALVVNLGPAPFTSLRVILATANGIGCATHIPLIGVDGLKAFVQEYADPAWPYTIAIFNAFNNDAYFAIDTPDTQEYGYKNIEQLLHELHACYPAAQLRFIGTGVKIFKNHILAIFKTNAYIPEPLPQYCSVEQLAKQIQPYWMDKSAHHKQLFPLYLKKAHYKSALQE
jgi:tRNA threonylcarbamoyl adenosine modification protein YeaZ